MANAHLVIGRGESNHITSSNWGALNIGIFGNESYMITDYMNGLAPQIIDNNKITIKNGAAVFNGRFIEVESPVELTIENGAQGYKRNDLIVLRYTKDASTGVEEANLVVIKGTPTTGTPNDPSFNNFKIYTNPDIADLPIYRVHVTDTEISKIDYACQFAYSLSDLRSTCNQLDTNIKTVENTLNGKIGMIGETIKYDFNNASIISGTWTNVAQFVISKGTWLVTLHIGFAKTLQSGEYAFNIRKNSAASNIYSSGKLTAQNYTVANYTTVIEVTSQSDLYYVNALQTSGALLDVGSINKSNTIFGVELVRLK